jgi:hypothetical protein
MTIQERVFLVGCERSGTTLLQSMLAANSAVFSIPESHFYDKLFGSGHWRWFLGIASRKARPRWEAFLTEIGHGEMQSRLPRYAFTIRQFSQYFVEVLDRLTLDQGKEIWLEKTPAHLHYIDQIERLIRGVKFVHILRKGKDNIASLYDIGLNFADKWTPEYKSLDRCIDRWVEDAKLSIRYSRRPNHYLVRYEHLVDDPKKILVGVCKFIGIPYEDQMLTDYPDIASKIILKTEPWKNNTFKPLQDTQNSKFQKLFDERQRQYVLMRLSKEISQDFDSWDLF